MVHVGGIKADPLTGGDEGSEFVRRMFAATDRHKFIADIQVKTQCFCRAVAPLEEATPSFVSDEEDMVAIRRNAMGFGKVLGHRRMNACSLNAEFTRDCVDLRDAVTASDSQ